MQLAQQSDMNVTLKPSCVKCKTNIQNTHTVIRCKPVQNLVTVQLSNLLYIDPTAHDLKARVTQLINVHNLRSTAWSGIMDDDGEIRTCSAVPFPSNAAAFNDFIAQLLLEHSRFFRELLRVYVGGPVLVDQKKTSETKSTQHFMAADGVVVLLDTNQNKIDAALATYSLPAGISQFIYITTYIVCTVAGTKDGKLWVVQHPSRTIVEPVKPDAKCVPICKADLPRCNPTTFTANGNTFDTSDAAIQRFLPDAVCGSLLNNGGRYYVIIGVFNNKLYARVKGDCKSMGAFASDFQFADCTLMGVTQIGSNLKQSVPSQTFENVLRRILESL